MNKLLMGIGAAIVLLIFIGLAMKRPKAPDVESKPAYVSSIEPVETSITPKIDIQAAKKLMPSFNFKKDEYSGMLWISHKSTPRFVNVNAIYCYWDASGEKPGPMRFRVQYLADDWLFIENMVFLIDGQTYKYVPLKIDHDNEDGDIWEWTDEVADEQGTNIIQALASAKKARVKFYGSKYFDERTITAAQLKAFKESVQMYQAMGGDL